jgi:hypothetical protein
MIRPAFPMRLAGFVFTLLALSQAAAAQAPDAKLMPAPGFVAGWQVSGTPKTYTSADLYGYIDGGAEMFLELGFEQLTIQRYKNGADELGVEIYRMTDAAAARAVYLARRGKETPDPSLKARHTASRHQLQFQRDRYYVIVNNITGKPATAPALVAAAGAVVAKIPADGAIAALALLPAPGLVPGSEKLIRGAYTLQAVFTLGDGDMLSLGGKLTAVAADYKTPAGAWTMIIADYPTPTAATAAFAYVKGHLDSYLKPTANTATSLTFQDFEKKFGRVSVTGKRLEIRVKMDKQPS